MSRERLSEVNGLKPVVINDIPYDEHEYTPSELDGFQYVFTKDNLPTYHQMYDNFLHWNWNEYGNDPTKFESNEYIGLVLDKVFTWINARMLGVINVGDNQPAIIQNVSNSLNSLLESINNVNHSNLNIDLAEVLAVKRGALEGRGTPFTKEDAIVWWTLESINGYWKPRIVPVFRVDGRDIGLVNGDAFHFYMMIFKYVIKYYNHVYGAKFQSTWMKVDGNDHITVAQVANSEMLNDLPARLHFITSGIKTFQCEEGCVVPIYISSDDGDHWDMWMNTYTRGLLTLHNGEYYISAERGFNLWRNNDSGEITKEFVECLVAKGKNHEALRTEMWRDVMDCGAVLFPVNEFDNLIIKVRITNVAKYKGDISNIMILALCRQLGKICNHELPIDTPPIEFSFGPDDIFYLDLQDPGVIMELWGVFEHTLDMWVQFGDRWSLICNIKKMSPRFYIDRPHIEYTKWDNMTSDSELPEGELLSIIPRDGMTWSHVTETGTNKHTYVNTTEYKKIYH